MNLEKAFDYYNDALNFFKSQGVINEMNICYSNIVEIYEKKCDFETAIENYSFALDGEEKTGYKPLGAYISSLKRFMEIAKQIGINDFIIDASQ